jgi:Rab3 GTPase-activating protein catalytic subunit
MVSDTREVEQVEKRPRIDSPPAASLSAKGGGRDTSDEFFDAEEAPTANVTLKRKGAYCPVNGLSLAATGDQLYAPYLQRSYPLTDDVIAERRRMLAQQEGTMASAVVQQRLEIAHRLQKPKLLSDMSSFKAANPGSGFQDFVSWYGNPLNPLDEYEELKSTEEMHLGVATARPVATKMDRAAEAIRVLNETRDLWSVTWDEAKPIPASHQIPLFDATNTVEITLDYLETLHPGSLLCQVMAVNLAMAYFALVTSAKDIRKVDTIGCVLESLRDKVESALRLLSLDATAGIGNILKQQEASPAPTFVASAETISSCERACAAVSQTEILVSRATSLLYKLPKQYDLVESIMKKTDATPIELSNGDCRDSVLQAIQRQQDQLSKTKTAGSNPMPAIRDYILRNVDDLNPHQLCVRYEDRGALPNAEGKGAQFLALTKYAKH